MYLQSYAHYDRDRALRDRDSDNVKVHRQAVQSLGACLIHCTPAVSANEEMSSNRRLSATETHSTSTRCRPNSRCGLTCLWKMFSQQCKITTSVQRRAGRNALSSLRRTNPMSDQFCLALTARPSTILWCVYLMRWCRLSWRTMLTCTCAAAAGSEQAAGWQQSAFVNLDRGMGTWLSRSRCKISSL